MRKMLALIVTLVLAGCGNGTAGGTDQPRKTDNFKAADRVPIVGFVYENPAPKAIILLFHQAGSSKYEYDPIGPRLAKDGYTAFAIDQRSGGSLYGDNSTVAIVGGSKSFKDAEQDLNGAVRWASRKNLPIIIWGSSYSAALVFRVAAENPTKVRAVIAFSPGEYLWEPKLVAQAAARLRVPVFITSAHDPREVAAAKEIFDAVPGKDKVQFMPTGAGAHGSSALRPDKNPQGAAEYWNAVEGFLRKVAP